MKENNELERNDIAIDNDMEVDCDIGQQITCYIETWFDVDAKFGTHTADDDGTWLNMYGKYNPYEDTLLIECEVCHDDMESEYFDYTPTPSEAQLIKEMIAEKIRQQYGQTPKEFCESVTSQDSEEVYVYENHARCSERELAERWKQIRAYMNAQGYDFSGSTTISLPMSMAGEHFRDMIDYCESRGITKILVTNSRDIANDENGLRRVLNRLCDRGFTVEVVSDGIAYAPQEQTKFEPVEAGEEMQLGGQV